jgi:outer membrane protein assembly factor BamB
MRADIHGGPESVSWQFAEEGALPLDLVDGKDADVLGPRSAPVKTTQFLGNAVGVTVVGDTVFAESDAGFVYALDAVTGRLRWRASVDNAAMGNPIVVGGRVFVGSGDTGFAFSQVMRAMAGDPLVRGLSWAGVYAFDAKDGKQLWRFGTRGESRPGRKTVACDHMHWGLRRAGIKIDVEAHAAVGQKFRLAQCQVMLRRADRSAVERCQYRASIVVVGANVEDHDESEHS